MSEFNVFFPFKQIIKRTDLEIKESTHAGA